MVLADLVKTLDNLPIPNQMFFSYKYQICGIRLCFYQQQWHFKCFLASLYFLDLPAACFHDVPMISFIERKAAMQGWDQILLV